MSISLIVISLILYLFSFLTLLIFSSYWFPVSNFIGFCIIFIISYFLLALGLYCSSFSSFLRCQLLYFRSSSLIFAFSAINFSQSIAFHSFFKITLFIFILMGNILKFLFWLLWLMCYLETCCLISKYLGILYDYIFSPLLHAIIFFKNYFLKCLPLNLQYTTGAGPPSNNVILHHL